MEYLRYFLVVSLLTAIGISPTESSGKTNTRCLLCSSIFASDVRDAFTAYGRIV